MLPASCGRKCEELCEIDLIESVRNAVSCIFFWVASIGGARISRFVTNRSPSETHSVWEQVCPAAGDPGSDALHEPPAGDRAVVVAAPRPCNEGLGGQQGGTVCGYQPAGRAGDSAEGSALGAVHGRSVNSLGQRREGLLSLAGGDRAWRSEQLIEEEVEDVVGLEGKWNLDRDRCSPWA